ncbi:MULTISPECIES: phosphopentomutase [unclassified Wenzhouxiangella]|uniref:phosphopentomutase n=1 Tax=unclassified Wenzhouxiangella TaxID=2613841 RepID=UPI000E32671C|nr:MULTISPECIES: phosphopentomutase [unclassified Wenzhouxiangella]RFF26866.1 phosphopentomutase [Wenzhouxiangella sp. 15181]RFP68480.1 phosphopentomutase [Wenzhouxiangella sp. 15190]
MPRALVIVLDSFGIGASADAERFGDAGADTLGHIAEYRSRNGRPLSLPNMARLGLFHAHRASTGQLAAGVTLPDRVDGAWGYAKEISSGKDTPSGHWEMAGVPVRFEWGYFSDRENSFPPELLEALIERADLPGVLGNCHASGTEIIARLGVEHIETGKPIVYTSADSVFQIAVHEQFFGLERLYRLCEIARELLDDYCGDNPIGRVIARPFVGNHAGDFKRTGNRRDFSVPPPSPTVLERLVDDGGEVIAVGKIADIFAHRGISSTIKADGNAALIEATLEAMDKSANRSLVMTNLVDFDMVHGHRRDPEGYADALEYFNKKLPHLIEKIDDDDLLILTADHGCDPTFAGSDHTREHVPVLARGAGLPSGCIGERATFADIGQTLGAFFGLAPLPDGESFLTSAEQAMETP